MTHPKIFWFKDIKPQHSRSFGPKATKLAYLAKHFSVPPGFVLSKQVFDHFLTETSLNIKIKSLLRETNSKNRQKTYQNVQNLIAKTKLSSGLTSLLHAHYAQAKKPVSVRSSALSEDKPFQSAAGLFTSILEVNSFDECIKAIKHVWASAYAPTVLDTLNLAQLKSYTPEMAVIIQELIPSEVSGTIFTANPVTQNKKEIVVEAVLGLGTALVQGWVTPDQYTLDKKTLKITHKTISSQTVTLKRQTKHVRKLAASGKKASRQKLADKAIATLAKQAVKIEAHYGHPQDIEWAWHKDTLYLLQTRPITTLVAKKKTSSNIVPRAALPEVYLHGVPVHHGVVVGRVKLHKPGQTIKLSKGDILVCKRLDLKEPVDISQIAGLITQNGGSSSEAAILSREMNIPGVVNVSQVTSKLKNNQLITVDATNGLIYRGKHKLDQETITLPKGIDHLSQLTTKTKLFLQLNSVHHLPHYSHSLADGLGLLSGSDLIKEFIQVHPQHLITHKKKKYFSAHLAEKIEEYCQMFISKPVFYQFSNLTSLEYSQLRFGKGYETVEPNPDLGMRGVGRFLAQPELLRAELDALNHVVKKYGYKNIHLVAPFVRSPLELKLFKQLIKQQKSAVSKLTLNLSLETSNSILNLNQFVRVGIKKVFIDLELLTQIVLNFDNHSLHSEKMLNTHIHPSVFEILLQILQACHKMRLEVIVASKSVNLSQAELKQIIQLKPTALSVKPRQIADYRIKLHKLETKK